MTAYVVDASIVIQRVVREVHTEHTRILFERVGEPDALVIPEFCLLECGNILWKHVRFHGMPSSTADALVRGLSGIPFTVRPVAEHLIRALEIGLNQQIAVYDSVYIAVAEALELALVTDDVRQAQAATAVGVRLKPITDFVR